MTKLNQQSDRGVAAGGRRLARASLLLSLLLLGVNFAVAGFKPGELNEVSRPLPVFSLDDLAGDAWTAAKLQGKPAIINFWASWCAPCREEMPSLNRAWDKVKDQGVQMLAVNLGDSRPTIDQFMSKVPIDFTVLLSTNPADLASWGVRGLPTTVVVNSEGQIVRELVGIAEWDSDEILDQVLQLRTQ